MYCRRLILLLVVLAVSPGVLSQDTKQKAPPKEAKKDTRVEPTHWGDVIGRVYDAGTGAPIVGASVRMDTEEGFQEKGRSVGKTDKLGGYKVQTILGRVSENFDIGRALLSSGIGLLFGSATNKTKRIDVARVNARVEMDGYKTFEGIVTARLQDAKAFRISLEPILLVPSGATGVPVSAAGWSRVKVISCDAQPMPAHKGDEVRITARVSALSVEVAKQLEVLAVCRYWRGERRMKLIGSVDSNGNAAFEATHKASGKETTPAEIVQVYIGKCPLDFRPEQRSWTLIQIAREPASESDMVQRSKAAEFLREHKEAEAATILSSLVSSGNATVMDLRMLSIASDRISDYATAADCLRKERSLLTAEERPATLANFARTSYLAKRYDDIVLAVEEELKGTKPNDWSKRVAPSTLGYLGLAYCKQKQMKKADGVNEALLRYSVAGLDPAVIEFRSAYRLAEVTDALERNPKDPTVVADYGRALLDLGRYEEAIASLSDSLKLNPDQVAIRRDLAWAALQLTGPSRPDIDLELAVQEAKVALNLEKGQQRSKDFFSWNQYAILLYALSERQKAAGDSAGEQTTSDSIDSLREALSLGRVGAKRNSGDFSYQFGYVSGSEVAISGFAYPQANASFVLLDSIKRLRKRADDYLALFNKASALYDLGQTQLAANALSQATDIAPAFEECQFLAALIDLRLGDPAKAQTTLERLVKGNPLHPRANLVLAKLLAENGDVAGSAERLAEHTRYYGEVPDASN